jgi:hypothetical protein
MPFIGRWKVNTETVLYIVVMPLCIHMVLLISAVGTILTHAPSISVCAIFFVHALFAIMCVSFTNHIQVYLSKLIDRVYV